MVNKGSENETTNIFTDKDKKKYPAEHESYLTNAIALKANHDLTSK